MSASDSYAWITHKDYVAGWLDGSIKDFLTCYPRTSKSTKYALVTSLDSHLSPGSLLETLDLERSPVEARQLGDGILLPTTTLLSSPERIFYGFDEVWFFSHPDITPKPRSVWIVGPRRIEQRKMNELATWMSSNGCSLALGDGDGINFIMKARGLVKHLLAYSIRQPQPEGGGEETEITT